MQELPHSFVFTAESSVPKRWQQKVFAVRSSICICYLRCQTRPEVETERSLFLVETSVSGLGTKKYTELSFATWCSSLSHTSEVNLCIASFEIVLWQRPLFLDVLLCFALWQSIHAIIFFKRVLIILHLRLVSMFIYCWQKSVASRRPLKMYQWQSWSTDITLLEA